MCPIHQSGSSPQNPPLFLIRPGPAAPTLHCPAKMARRSTNHRPSYSQASANHSQADGRGKEGRKTTVLEPLGLILGCREVQEEGRPDLRKSLQHQEAPAGPIGLWPRNCRLYSCLHSCLLSPGLSPAALKLPLHYSTVQWSTIQYSAVPDVLQYRHHMPVHVLFCACRQGKRERCEDLCCRQLQWTEPEQTTVVDSKNQGRPLQCTSRK